MLKSKKRLGLFAICLSLVIISGTLVFFVGKNNNNESLRNKYPIIKESEYLIDDAALDFNDRVKLSPYIAKIDVIKQLPDYTVHIEDAEIGISTDIEFCQFQVRLITNISDESITTDSDGTFVITYAKELESSYPAMADGTNAICSLEPASGAHIGKYLFFDRTFYYTDSNMALAAYEGDDSFAKNICTEEKLVSQIKEIRNK